MRTGEWVDKLTVTTNFGRTMSWGGNGGVEHDLGILPGDEVHGFYGSHWFSSHIFSIGALTYFR